MQEGSDATAGTARAKQSGVRAGEGSVLRNDAWAREEQECDDSAYTVVTSLCSSDIKDRRREKGCARLTCEW